MLLNIAHEFLLSLLVFFLLLAMSWAIICSHVNPRRCISEVCPSPFSLNMKKKNRDVARILEFFLMWSQVWKPWFEPFVLEFRSYGAFYRFQPYCGARNESLKRAQILLIPGQMLQEEANPLKSAIEPRLSFFLIIFLSFTYQDMWAYAGTGQTFGLKVFSIFFFH